MLPDGRARAPHGAFAQPHGMCGRSAGPARGSSGVWQAGFSPVIGRQAVSPPLDGQTGRGATQELPGLSHLCGGAAQEHSSSRHTLENREQSSRILRWGMPDGSDPEGQLRSKAPAVTPSRIGSRAPGSSDEVCLMAVTRRGSSGAKLQPSRPRESGAELQDPRICCAYLILIALFLHLHVGG